MLVDDYDVVRTVAETLLKARLPRVLVARDGEEALRIHAERADEIDLVLLDLTMPILSGKECFRRLRAEHPYVPVLICSGYLLDLKEFEAETGACPEGFVQKPYRIEQMAETVRKVLDDTRRAA
ncbi:MAG: response regulator [Akkermansiaceae bacterium]|nr:response regulator [Akkermansiaceae bacterium]